MLRSVMGRYSVIFLVLLVIGAIFYRSLAERPYWAYSIVALVALIPAALFFNSRQGVHLMGLLAMLILIAAIWLADSLQVTDKERVYQIANELGAAVERGDISVMERHVSEKFSWQGKNRAYFLSMARNALTARSSRTCSLTSSVIEQMNENELTLGCTLYAQGEFGQYNDVPGFLGRVNLRFVRDTDGQIRLRGVSVRDHTGNYEYSPP